MEIGSANMTKLAHKWAIWEVANGKIFDLIDLKFLHLPVDRLIIGGVKGSFDAQSLLYFCASSIWPCIYLLTSPVLNRQVSKSFLI